MLSFYYYYILFRDPFEYFDTSFHQYAMRETEEQCNNSFVFYFIYFGLICVSVTANFAIIFFTDIVYLYLQKLQLDFRTDPFLRFKKRVIMYLKEFVFTRLIHHLLVEKCVMVLKTNIDSDSIFKSSTFKGFYRI